MERNYSNREIDAMQRTIHEKLDKILEQTTATNGRVTSLEGRANVFKGWTMGFGVSISIILVLLVYIFNLRIDNITHLQNVTPDINITSLNK